LLEGIRRGKNDKRKAQTDMIKEGSIPPEIDLPRDGGGRLRLSALKGQIVVLYFYPKDDTPGCTKEALGFTERLEDFTALGATVIGVSPDTVQAHDRFKAKHDLGVTLVSDQDREAACAYDVWVEKKNYGKTYMGIDRATFLIGKDWRIARIWRKVKVAGHVDAVYDAIKALQV
jgi:peroxiredoxin Q/BCP